MGKTIRAAATLLVLVFLDITCSTGAYEVWPASTRVYLPAAFRRFW